MVGSVDRWPSKWEKRWSIRGKVVVEGASADTAAVRETVWFEVGNKSARLIRNRNGDRVLATGP